jgi:ribonucleoside-diphosphate reductase alpha chain
LLKLFESASGSLIQTNQPAMAEAKEGIRTYNYSDALQQSILYFDGDELAATTWLNKYAMKNLNGELLESVPSEMHKRMAAAFARIEDHYETKFSNRHDLSDYGRERTTLTEEKIFQLFDRFRYVIPQGSVMSALNNPHMFASLSNCVVLPELFDSYGGIFFADQQLAQLFKRRCGVGLDLSSLRPAGSSVSNAAQTTTGAVSFMDRFSNTTREVSQLGRRGALMLTMDVAHPDVQQFISIKQDLSRVTGANISLRLSDEFMYAVESNSEFTLRFPVDAESPVIKKNVSARDLWNKIIHAAHTSAEPGLIFWDHQHRYSTSSVYPEFKNVSTNPCSEIAMQGGDSCRLIAVNLYSFVNHPFTAQAAFDYGKFYQVIYESQRLMDDLVDLELEAIDRILQKVEADPEPVYIKDNEIRTWKMLKDAGVKGRRTGLGFTALADALAALNVPFDSDEAFHHTEKIMREKCRAEFDSSIDMAIERGKFQAFDPQIEKTSAFVQMMQIEFPEIFSRMMKHGRRNISLSTVAPTGTLSLLAQSSSGIEPVFMLEYKRRRKVNSNDPTAKPEFVDQSGDAWQEFTVFHPKLKDWMNISGKNDVAESPYAGSTAGEINWEKRIQLQSIVQKYTTHSISSTINLKTDVPEELVGKIYFEAWKKGLKGITVYRDGSRSGVLVANQPENNNSQTPERTAPKRPVRLEASVVRFMNGDEKWIAYVGLLENKPYEIFTGRVKDGFIIPDYINKGSIVKRKANGKKAEYDFEYVNENSETILLPGLSHSFNKEFWNYAKLISGVLRHGMPIVQVIHLIKNMHLDNDTINSWKAGVERALKQFIPDGTLAVDHLCPECGDPEGMIYQEGCLTCKSCGNTKCG